MAKKIKKAVSLISGGLDSLLATKVILDQGVHVEGINFFTGFCVEGHTHAIRKKKSGKKPIRNNSLWVAEQLGIKLHIIDIIEPYKDILLNPKYGYGANINPCLDCKVFMVNKAKEWMEENGFDFIITGEVVGQRPMSQMKHKMKIVSENSGADDILVRPLSAKNLPPTKPEELGWIDREKLLDFHGRNRSPQMRLAEKFGFDDYATPAGGCCFLTDENYSKKLSDMWTSRNNRDYELDDLMLLKVGRHLRPKLNFKIIVSREEGETNFLQGYKNKFISLRMLDTEGPLTLIDGDPVADDLIISARITARFSKARENEEAKVEVRFKDGETKVVKIKPYQSEEIPKDWYI